MQLQSQSIGISMVKQTRKKNSARMLCVMVNHVLLGDIFQEHTRFTYALGKYVLQVVWKNIFCKFLWWLPNFPSSY